jgi:hypothetical protein
MRELESQITALTSTDVKKIGSPQTFKLVADRVKLRADLRKEISGTFDPIIKKAHEAHKEAVAQKKRYTEPLDKADEFDRKALALYHDEQKSLQISDEDVMVVMPQEQPKVDGISSRDAWKFEVTNAAIVPREYLSVDEKKIGKVVAALKEFTSIPGIRVYSETVIVRR